MIDSPSVNRVGFWRPNDASSGRTHDLINAKTVPALPRPKKPTGEIDATLVPHQQTSDLLGS
jgi:hypothetical protein